MASGERSIVQTIFASRIPARNVVPRGDESGSPPPSDLPYQEDRQTRSRRLSAQDLEPSSASADQPNGSSHCESGNGLLSPPLALYEAVRAHPGAFSLPEDSQDLHPNLEDKDASGSAPSAPTIRMPVSNCDLHPDYSLSSQNLDGGLPGTPYVIDPLMHRGYQAAVSRKSGGSNGSVKSFGSLASAGRASYRQHTGPKPHSRSPSIRNSHSAVQSAAVPGPHVATQTEATLVESGAQRSSHSFHAVAMEPHPTVESEHPRFVQMTSADVKRYQRNCFNIRKPTKGNYKIDAMQYKYPLHDNNLPAEWKAHRHPEGALFYLLDRSIAGGRQRTFTEVDVNDEDIRGDVEYFSSFLWGELRHEVGERSLQDSLNLDEVQLVVEPRSDENGVLCCYYFVDPTNRSLFWLDEWEAHDVFSACKGVNTLSHKGLAIQAHYWGHWDLYPTLCKVTEELKQEAVDMIVHAICDHLTSNVSPAPLNTGELESFLGFLTYVKPHDRGHGAVVFGRIMKMFYLNYYLNFHGEPCARLNFDQSVHGWKYRPSVIMTVCTPLLFFSPMTSIRNLNSMFVDGIVSREKWNAFIKRMNSYLTNTNLLATVLLSANVGFLSIHTVDDGNGTTLRQISSYLSLMASCSSILVGLILVRHNRTESPNFVFAAAKFLDALWHPVHGLEILAIAYSLPHAFLLWGMILFFIALSAEWWNPGNLTSWVIVGIAMLVTLLLVGWCTWTSRDRVGYWWFQADPAQPCADDDREGDLGMQEISRADQGG